MTLHQQFIDFINTQQPDKAINNSSWGLCAVGEFYAHIGTEIPQAFLKGCAKENEEIFAYNWGLWKRLENGIFRNYGELQTWIEAKLYA